MEKVLTKVLPDSDDAASTPAQDLVDLIEQLPLRQSEVIKMRYIDERTFEEIALSLKTSPLNIRKIVSRALRSLRQKVDEGRLK